MSPPLYP